MPFTSIISSPAGKNLYSLLLTDGEGSLFEEKPYLHINIYIIMLNQQL